MGEDGKFVRNKCRGPRKVQCCIIKKTNTPTDEGGNEVGVGDSCVATDGTEGVCKINSGNTKLDCGEDGKFVRNKCRGPRKVQCCIVGSKGETEVYEGEKGKLTKLVHSKLMKAVNYECKNMFDDQFPALGVDAYKGYRMVEDCVLYAKSVVGVLYKEKAN